MTKQDEILGKIKQKPEPGFYKKGRQFVFRSNFHKKDVALYFKAASSGYLPKAARGHADALSIALNVGESPFLVDPGTITYQSEAEWKKYFRSTLSHNTIKINLKNQTEVTKQNSRLSHYKTNILETKFEKDSILIKAEHDGYKKMGINHSRKIKLDKLKNLIWITDTIECQKSGYYFVELPFHFHPKTIVKQNNPVNFQASDEKENMIYVVTDKKFKTKLIRGQIIPQILGWYSDSKERKEPCSTIYCTALIEQTVTFQTIILIK
jgi:hypothetical protein